MRKYELGPYTDFWESLMQMWETHTSKNHDYAGDHETYFNFTYASMVAAPFRDEVDKVFATMLGIKLARLAVLKGTGRKPKNESVLDTHKDLATYATIWWTREKERAYEHGRRVRAGVRQRQREANDRRRSTSKTRASKSKATRRSHR